MRVLKALDDARVSGGFGDEDYFGPRRGANEAKRGKDGLTEIVSRLLCSGYIAFESESRQKDWRMPGLSRSSKINLV